MSTEIRPALPGDRPALEAMMAALQDHERAMEANRTPGAEMAASHLDALAAWAGAHPGGGILIARTQDAPAGMIVFGVDTEFGTYVPEETRRIGRISDLYVVPGRRGSGLGRRLIAAAEARLRGAGLRRIEISAVPANRAALALYERLGYAPALVTLAKGL